MTKERREMLEKLVDRTLKNNKAIFNRLNDI